MCKTTDLRGRFSKSRCTVHMLCVVYTTMSHNVVPTYMVSNVLMIIMFALLRLQFILKSILIMFNVHIIVELV